MADFLRAEGVDCYRGGKDQQAREEGGELRIPKPAGLLLVVLLACRGPSADAESQASGREPSTRILTDSTAYSLRSDGPGWTTSIGFAYRAEADTVYIVNCNGAILMTLQKHELEGWTDAWFAEGPGCLSPPIVIPPGEVFDSEVLVWGADFGDRSHNAFRVPEIDGEYRLVWNQPVHHYEPRLGSFGDTLPLAERVSNTFALKRAAGHR